MPAPLAIHHLVYSSDATRPMSVEELQKLLGQARAFNQGYTITGLLFYSEGLPGTSSAGSFFQVLEGEEEALRALVEHIRHDPRNTNLQVLIDGPAPERLFPDWSMGFMTVIPPDMEALTGFVNPHEARFLLHRALSISPELRVFIETLLTDYPPWPYPPA